MRFLIEPSQAGQGNARVLQEYPAWVLAEADVVPPAAIEVLQDETVSVLGRPVLVPEGSFTGEPSPRYVIRFAGPLAPAWREGLAQGGVQVHFWCPRFGACVSLPDGLSAADLGRRFWFVAGAVPLRQEHCERPPALSALRSIPSDLVDVVCFSRDDRERVATELSRSGATVVATSSSKLRVRYQGSLAVLRELVGVKLVEPTRGHQLSGSPLAQALGATTGTGDWLPDLDGEGETVAVADSGLDVGTINPNLHADFAGRVRQLISWPINPSWADYVTQPGGDDGGADRNSGHGTHVAGLAMGNGSRSQGQHRGVAPKAELVFQALEQFTATKPAVAARMPSGFYLSGRPLDLRELFEQARAFGAFIHVNAWGDPAAGAYTNDSFEADHFLHEHPDALILFAAGNDGADRDGNRRADPGTLHAPGTAKNVLTVGATEGPLAGVGFRGTWGQVDPANNRFRHYLDRQDPVSGEPDRLAIFSSAGPTADGRIKPDLCAPGTNLCAPRSAVAAQQGWGLADPLPHYMYFGGTSMATGIAGGAAAVVRQAWRRELAGKAPSGAALKALLILGAQPVLARDGSGFESRLAAGFGRFSISRSLPGSTSCPVVLHDVAEPGLEAGSLREFPFQQTSPGPFKAVLCWYDVSAEALVNDLDLVLEGPDGSRTWGNHPAGRGGEPDRKNTVEVIEIATLSPGRYRMLVIAANAPAGPQGFALALTAPQSRRSGLGIPVESLNRIGKKTASSFRARGFRYADSLRGLDDQTLVGAGALSPRRLARLKQQLTVLDSARAEPFIVKLPDGLTWAAALTAAPPPGMSAPDVVRGRAGLAAASTTVPRSWWGRLQVNDLRV